jgi:hypothetical protein
MTRSSLVSAALVVILSNSSIGDANSANPDPVVITFSSEAGSIQMELGFIREIRLEPKDDSFSVRVIFEPEGVRFYNRFAFQYRSLPTDLFICEDKVFTYATMPYLRNDSFSLPVRYSKTDAETVMDLLFYGDDCENYL